MSFQFYLSWCLDKLKTKEEDNLCVLSNVKKKWLACFQEYSRLANMDKPDLNQQFVIKYFANLCHSDFICVDILTNWKQKNQDNLCVLSNVWKNGWHVFKLLANMV